VSNAASTAREPIRQQLVERVDGSDAELDREGVTAFCKGRLADFKVPRHIEFVTESPLTAAGKIQRLLLRAEAASTAGAARA
jgi:fatty-acyl-CoA synthase